MVDISNSEPTDVAQWRFVPDREKAALSGVSAADIANVLGLVYDGQVVGRAHIDPERNPVPIRASVPRAEQPRSEEHTSELQSLMRLTSAVFCLKKKSRAHVITHTTLT